MNLLNVDLNLLKVLNALIEERNVTRAGERIGRSQPAMSNALNRLRAMFDDQLLVRGSGGLQLTPRAESLKEPVTEILESIEDCLITDANFEPATAHGLYRIAAPDYISLPIMPKLMGHLAKLAPNMDIHIITEDRDLALEALDRNRVDIALGNFSEPKKSIRQKHLFDEDFVCLLRENHPALKSNKKITVETLLSYPHLLVSASGERSGIFDDILSRSDSKRRIAVSVSHFLLAPYLLEDSDMVGVFTRRVSSTLSRSFKLVEREIPMELASFEASMAWHMRSDRDPAMNWLREQIKLLCVKYGPKE
ncbi:MAG: LysR family transcriptional regulator [Rhodospirillaceae bacterium]|nr:LysR family transcriptional regulator [Rhodospirillaceae bacterium]